MRFLEGLDNDLREGLLAQIKISWTHDSTAIEGNTIGLVQCAGQRAIAGLMIDFQAQTKGLVLDSQSWWLAQFKSWIGYNRHVPDLSAGSG